MNKSGTSVRPVDVAGSSEADFYCMEVFVTCDDDYIDPITDRRISSPAKNEDNAEPSDGTALVGKTIVAESTARIRVLYLGYLLHCSHGSGRQRP
ncbi:hypothetical protein HPB50_017017 [Hyalomma asiaticum]|uniref:Uncharacterized protein n=1 Tax=Hyalomma asiaticum TaxID=266040 RepID=A0ACB7RJ42_HYAAI|nr:hypothetical protein HPB50_017017 [Hyalomma asiaticum]